METEEAIERVPQSRRRSWGDIDALAESIRRDGQITAALVRELAPGRYQLVCGERRLRACEQLGIPLLCEVRDMTEAQTHLTRIAENTAREDLDIVEEAEAFAEAIDQHGFTVDELAVRVGREEMRRRRAAMTPEERREQWRKHQRAKRERDRVKRAGEQSS